MQFSPYQSCDILDTGQKGKKGVVCIPQPVMIQQYNKGMGGIDLFDQFRGKYRVAFRKRAALGIILYLDFF